MSEGFINKEYITDYVIKSIKPHDGILREMETFARAEENHVPIADRGTCALLEVLCAIKRPEYILEIGTAIGYSSMAMLKSSDSVKRIDTIERYEKMYDIANKNIESQGIKEKINVILGDAADVLPSLEEKYDLIFLDAAKGQYPSFLPYLINVLNDGGVLVCDNILYKGMTASDELVVRRKKTIVKRLRQFVEMIMSDERLMSSLVPIGDGVTISVKRDVKND